MNFKSLLSAVKNPKVFVPVLVAAAVAGVVLVKRNSGVSYEEPVEETPEVVEN